MNHPEQEFWNRLRKHLPGFTQRIETSTGNGVPDVYCCWKSKPFWLELKIWTPGTGILLRKEQWAWAKQHEIFGGHSFVLAQTPIDNVILVMHISEIKVEVYGTQEKYVVAKTKVDRRDTACPRNKVGEALQKWLFP